MIGTLVMAPFKVLGWFIKHPRVLVLTVLVFFGFLIFRGCATAFGGSSAAAPSKVADYQTVAPTEQQAPYVIQTATRMYYVAKYIDKNNIVTLQQYYTYDKSTWQVRSRPLVLDRRTYGVITVSKR